MLVLGVLSRGVLAVAGLAFGVLEVGVLLEGEEDVSPRWRGRGPVARQRPAGSQYPRGQRGQAMVEFTMILPILLLLTFGTIEIGLYLQRRVVLGGVTFVAARTAAVQGPRAASTVQKVLTTYAEDTNARWIAETVGSARLSREGARRLRLQVSRDGDLWTGALTGSMELTGKPLAPQARWKTEYPISQEFVPGGPGGSSFARKPTDIMVDYRARIPWMSQVPNFSGMLSKVPGNFGGEDLMIALNPAEQATRPNPMDRNGSTSPSKKYVSPYNESREFQHAGKMASGLRKLQQATVAFYVAYLAAYSVPGTPVVDKGFETVVKGFAEADRTLKFAETARNLESAMHAFYGAKAPRK